MKWTIGSAVVRDTYVEIVVSLLAEAGDTFQITACDVLAQVALPVAAGDVAAAIKAKVAEAVTNQKRAAAQSASKAAAQTVANAAIGTTGSVAV